MYTATLSRIRTLCRLLLRITSRKDNPAQTSSRHPCSEGFSLSEVPLNSMQTLLSRLQLISPSVQMSFGGESSANPSPKAILDSCSDMDRKFRASTKVTDRLHEYSFICEWMAEQRPTTAKSPVKKLSPSAQFPDPTIKAGIETDWGIFS